MYRLIRLMAVFVAMGGGLCLGTVAAEPAVNVPAERPVRVDDAGILRWGDDGAEVCLFGVNYYAPHVMDFSNIKAVGASVEETIDRDLAHFVRMGFDALRLHVFDCELSDKEGNLVDNEHLQLLDYLIAHAKERGIYTVLTPIAWWKSGNNIGGFSMHYLMPEMTAGAEARAAQQRYLKQFVEHVNRYTGLAYKDDPAIPVFELINEPLYAPNTPDAAVVEYINALVDAVRSTGCAKPLFYNGWCERHAAVRDSKVDGCSFGWYPTGLVAGHSLKGNFLPRVDDYPSMRSEELAKKAKIVYEFDSADVPGGHLYAGMARGFRSGGAQIATQFQYEPLPVGAFNAGWGTHYLNLVYAPHRAVGFTIACEVFHTIPRLAQFGTYPESARFGPFRVSYEEDLAEMASEDAFLYSNDTTTTPPAPDKLQRVAGCGSSPIVRYDGSGAYFLDKLAPGAWRLEVYPDAVWVADPFSLPNSLDREVSRVLWRQRRFGVHLPDLGESFRVEGLNEGNTHTADADGGGFVAGPGVYLLSRPGIAFDSAGYANVGRLGLREFVAPAQSRTDLVVQHEPLREVINGRPVSVEAMVIGEFEPDEVLLHVARQDSAELSTLPMTPVKPYGYAAQIPSEWIPSDTLSYAVSVRMAGETHVFPWNLSSVSPPDSARPVERLLMDGWRGESPSMGQGEAAVVAGSKGGIQAVRLTSPGFDEGQATGIRVEAIPGWIRPSGRALSADANWTLVVRARALVPQTTAVEVGLINAKGDAYGADVPLSDTWHNVRVPVKKLRPLWNTKGSGLAVDDVKTISLIFGAWLYGNERSQPHGVEIERIALECPASFWQVPVLPNDAPVVLFDAARHPVHARGSVPAEQGIVGGRGENAPAFRVSVKAFGPPPSSVMFRNDVTQELALRQDSMPPCDAVRITARAITPNTDALELVLVEKDGTPWGTNVPLTTEWRDIEIPLAQLRFFSHWPDIPRGRGQQGDSIRYEAVTAVSVCFGAWLFPEHVDEPHSIEIERIVLVQGAQK